MWIARLNPRPPAATANMLTGRVTGEVAGVLTSCPALLSPQPQTEPSVPRTAPVRLAMGTQG